VQITRDEIERALKNYHWMINSISIMEKRMDDIHVSTNKFGVEASLPKPQGTTSDPVYGEVKRRSRYWKKIEEYKKKTALIQELSDCITDEREYEVLTWILNGKGYRWIARHIGLSETHIRRIKDSIVEQMYKTAQMSQTA